MKRLSIIPGNERNVVQIVARIIDKVLRRGIIPKRMLAEFLPPNPVVVEAGAYNGRDTKEMSLLWPAGQIHAFEPVQEIYSKLTRTVRRCPNVRCYQLALAAENGRAPMYVSRGGSFSSSSLLRPKEHITIHPGVSFDASQVIETITLDAWQERSGIERVDFLWLDTQGTELEIMKQGRNVMNTVRAVFTEVSLREMYEGAPLYPEVKLWMMSNGFSVRHEILPWEDMGNVLFIREGY